VLGKGSKTGTEIMELGIQRDLDSLDRLSMLQFGNQICEMISGFTNNITHIWTALLMLDAHISKLYKTFFTFQLEKA
jgi:hypothetical protein